MASRTTEIILTGNATRAVAALNQVGQAASRNSKVATDAFSASTSKVGGIFSNLASQAGSFGVPFSNALGVIGSKVDEAGKKTSGFGSTLSRVGAVEAIAAGAGLVAFGSIAVKTALEGEAAHARLEVAVKNAGGAYKSYSGAIADTSQHLAKFGFTNAEVESSIATLIPAAHNVGKAIELQGLAADIARGRNIDLGTATSLLAKVETGHVALLGRLGIATKDATGKTISSEEAIKRLTAIYGGDAQKYAGTFAGKLAALGAEGKNLAETVGNALIPKIEGLTSATVSGISGFESANRATDGWLGKITLTATALPVAIFAADKLRAGVVALGGAYDRTVGSLGKTLGITKDASAAMAASAAANDAASASTLSVAAADDAVATATATRIAATEAVAAATAQELEAQQGVVAASLASADANAALADAQYQVATSSIADEAALNAVTAASERAAVAAGELAAADQAAAFAGREVAAAQSIAASANIGEGLAAEAAAVAEAEHAAAQAAQQLGTTVRGVAAAGESAAGGLGRFIKAGGEVGLAVGAALALGAAYLKLDDTLVGVRFPDAEIKQFSADLFAGGQAAQNASQQFAHLLGTDVSTDLQKYRDLLLTGASASDLAAAKANTLADARNNVQKVTSLGAGVDEIYNNRLRETAGAVDVATSSMDALVKKYGEAGVQTLELQVAQKKYADDLATGHASEHQLAIDRQNVVDAAKTQTKTQNEVNAATDEGTAAATGNAAALKDQAAAAKKLKDENDAALTDLGKLAGPAAQRLVASLKLPTDTIKNLTTEVKDMDKSFESSFDSANNAVDKFKDKSNVSFGDFVKEQFKTLTATQNWSANLGKLVKAGLSPEALKPLVAAGAGGAGVVQTLADHIGTGSVQIENSLATAATSAKASWEAIFGGSVTGTTQAADDWNAVGAATADLTKKYGSFNTLAGEVTASNGKNRVAQQGLIDTQKQLGPALVAVGAAASKQAQDHEILRQQLAGVHDASLVAKAGQDAEIGSLRGLEAQFPELTPAIEAFIRKLQGIKSPPPVHVSTTFDVYANTSQAEQALSHVLNLASTAGLNTAGIGLQVAIANRGAAYHAKGGPVEKGKEYIVGEEGPELFVPSGVRPPDEGPTTKTEPALPALIKEFPNLRDLLTKFVGNTRVEVAPAKTEKAPRAEPASERLRDVAKEVSTARTAFDTQVRPTDIRSRSSLTPEELFVNPDAAKVALVRLGNAQEKLTHLHAAPTHAAPVPKAKATVIGKGGPELFIPETSGTIIPHGKFVPRETGGPVERHKPYLVGEKGPELFVPYKPGAPAPTAHAASALPEKPNAEVTMLHGVEKRFPSLRAQVEKIVATIKVVPEKIVAHKPSAPLDKTKPTLIGKRGPEVFIPDVKGTIVPHGKFIEPREVGGPVSAGNPYLVGEQKPEWFVPSSAHRMGQQPLVIRNEYHLTVQSLDPRMSSQLVLEAMREIERRQGYIPVKTAAA